ncbi:hypothetical protein NDU88_004385 [Pleurodeles waltl]|uniref:Uncharacterized protein n=1 Tax=Pleurodeles waltl TaxID=8319 RepID=A0AAV7KZC2_PLEWA|nr:hypothetical protein NDU88_004385 [Pleurodeles waltl]
MPGGHAGAASLLGPAATHLRGGYLRPPPKKRLCLLLRRSEHPGPAEEHWTPGGRGRCKKRIDVQISPFSSSCRLLCGPEVCTARLLGLRAIPGPLTRVAQLSAPLCLSDTRSLLLLLPLGLRAGGLHGALVAFLAFTHVASFPLQRDADALFSNLCMRKHPRAISGVSDMVGRGSPCPRPPFCFILLFLHCAQAVAAGTTDAAWHRWRPGTRASPCQRGLQKIHA